MKEYIISRTELVELLEAYHRLAALESGGVDNWEWYCDSTSDYIKEYIKDNDITIDDEEMFDFWFSDIAEKEVEHYRGYNF